MCPHGVRKQHYCNISVDDETLHAFGRSLSMRTKTRQNFHPDIYTNIWRYQGLFYSFHLFQYSYKLNNCTHCSVLYTHTLSSSQHTCENNQSSENCMILDKHIKASSKQVNDKTFKELTLLFILLKY